MLVTTKERLLQFLDKEGITKSEFYSFVDIKRGLLDSDKMKSTIADPVLAKILVSYPKLNIVWLLTGTGEMYNKEEEKDDDTKNNDPLFLLYKEEKAAKESLLKEIGMLEERIRHLKEDTPSYGMVADHAYINKSSLQSQQNVPYNNAHSGKNNVKSTNK